MPGQFEEINGKRATFGMGCFWAGDCLFGVIDGVLRTCVGYSAGDKDNPTYKSIGDHTEVIDIEYDSSVISYSELLRLFWENHEYALTKPIKRQYMSIILYHDEEQKLIAEQSKETKQRELRQNVITEIMPFSKFYPAEDYHQKYRLQKHPWLVESLGLTSGELLRTSTLAAKLNGFVAGAVSQEKFEKALPRLDLSEKVLQYVEKQVIEEQGSGLYC